MGGIPPIRLERATDRGKVRRTQRNEMSSLRAFVSLCAMAYREHRARNREVQRQSRGRTACRQSGAVRYQVYQRFSLLRLLKGALIGVFASKFDPRVITMAQSQATRHDLGLFARDLFSFRGAGAQRVPAGQITLGLVWRIAFKARHSIFSVDLNHVRGNPMNSIVYIVGAVVIILAILGFLGLR
jgi:hypothetical protein